MLLKKNTFDLQRLKLRFFWFWPLMELDVPGIHLNSTMNRQVERSKEGGKMNMVNPLAPAEIPTAGFVQIMYRVKYITENYF